MASQTNCNRRLPEFFAPPKPGVVKASVSESNEIPVDLGVQKVFGSNFGGKGVSQGKKRNCSRTLKEKKVTWKCGSDDSSGHSSDGTDEDFLPTSAKRKKKSSKFVMAKLKEKAGVDIKKSTKSEDVTKPKAINIGNVFLLMMKKDTHQVLAETKETNVQCPPPEVRGNIDEKTAVKSNKENLSLSMKRTKKDCEKQDKIEEGSCCNGLNSSYSNTSEISCTETESSSDVQSIATQSYKVDLSLQKHDNCREQNEASLDVIVIDSVTSAMKYTMEEQHKSDPLCKKNNSAKLDGHRKQKGTAMVKDGPKETVPNAFSILMENRNKKLELVDDKNCDEEDPYEEESVQESAITDYFSAVPRSNKTKNISKIRLSLDQKESLNFGSAAANSIIALNDSMEEDFESINKKEMLDDPIQKESMEGKPSCASSDAKISRKLDEIEKDSKKFSCTSTDANLLGKLDGVEKRSKKFSCTLTVNLSEKSNRDLNVFPSISLDNDIPRKPTKVENIFLDQKSYCRMYRNDKSGQSSDEGISFYDSEEDECAIENIRTCVIKTKLGMKASKKLLDKKAKTLTASVTSNNKILPENLPDSAVNHSSAVETVVFAGVKVTGENKQRNGQAEADEFTSDDNDAYLDQLTSKMHSLTKQTKKKIPQVESSEDEEELDRLTEKMHRLSKKKTKLTAAKKGNLTPRNIMDGNSDFDKKLLDDDLNSKSDLTPLIYEESNNSDPSKTDQTTISKFFKNVTKSEVDSKRHKSVVNVVVDVHAPFELEKEKLNSSGADICPKCSSPKFSKTNSNLHTVHEKKATFCHSNDATSKVEKKYSSGLTPDFIKISSTNSDFDSIEFLETVDINGTEDLGPHNHWQPPIRPVTAVSSGLETAVTDVINVTNSNGISENTQISCSQNSAECMDHLASSSNDYVSRTVNDENDCVNEAEEKSMPIDEVSCDNTSCVKKDKPLISLEDGEVESKVVISNKEKDIYDIRQDNMLSAITVKIEEGMKDAQQKEEIQSERITKLSLDKQKIQKPQNSSENLLVIDLCISSQQSTCDTLKTDLSYLKSNIGNSYITSTAKAAQSNQCWDLEGSPESESVLSDKDREIPIQNKNLISKIKEPQNKKDIKVFSPEHCSDCEEKLHEEKMKDSDDDFVCSASSEYDSDSNEMLCKGKKKKKELSKNQSKATSGNKPKKLVRKPNAMKKGVHDGKQAGIGQFFAVKSKKSNISSADAVGEGMVLKGVSEAKEKSKDESKAPSSHLLAVNKDPVYHIPRSVNAAVASLGVSDGLVVAYGLLDAEGPADDLVDADGLVESDSISVNVPLTPDVRRSARPKRTQNYSHMINDIDAVFDGMGSEDLTCKAKTRRNLKCGDIDEDFTPQKTKVTSTKKSASKEQKSAAKKGVRRNRLQPVKLVLDPISCGEATAENSISVVDDGTETKNARVTPDESDFIEKIAHRVKNTLEEQGKRKRVNVVESDSEEESGDVLNKEEDDHLNGSVIECHDSLSNEAPKSLLVSKENEKLVKVAGKGASTTSKLCLEQEPCNFQEVVASKSYAGVNDLSSQPQLGSLAEEELVSGCKRRRRTCASLVKYFEVKVSDDETEEDVHEVAEIAEKGKPLLRKGRLSKRRKVEADADTIGLTKSFSSPAAMKDSGVKEEAVGTSESAALRRFRSNSSKADQANANNSVKKLTVNNQLQGVKGPKLASIFWSPQSATTAALSALPVAVTMATQSSQDNRDDDVSILEEIQVHTVRDDDGPSEQTCHTTSMEDYWPVLPAPCHVTQRPACPVSTSENLVSVKMSPVPDDSDDFEMKGYKKCSEDFQINGRPVTETRDRAESYLKAMGERDGYAVTPAATEPSLDVPTMCRILLHLKETNPSFPVMKVFKRYLDCKTKAVEMYKSDLTHEKLQKSMGGLHDFAKADSSIINLDCINPDKEESSLKINESNKETSGVSKRKRPKRRSSVIRLSRKRRRISRNRRHPSSSSSRNSDTNQDDTIEREDSSCSGGDSSPCNYEQETSGEEDVSSSVRGRRRSKTSEKNLSKLKPQKKNVRERVNSSNGKNLSDASNVDKNEDQEDKGTESNDYTPMWAAHVPYTWTDVFAPTLGDHIIGSEGTVCELRLWLERWKQKCQDQQQQQCNTPRKKPRSNKTGGAGSSTPTRFAQLQQDSDWGSDYCYDSDDSSCGGGGGGGGSTSGNTALLAGPPGCGKTALVYALAQQLGYKVLEVNASSRRTGKSVTAKLAEATQSQSFKQVQSLFLSSAQSHQLFASQSLSPKASTSAPAVIAKSKLNPIAALFQKRKPTEPAENVDLKADKRNTSTNAKKNTDTSKVTNFAAASKVPTSVTTPKGTKFGNAQKKMGTPPASAAFKASRKLVKSSLKKSSKRSSLASSPDTSMGLTGKLSLQRKNPLNKKIGRKSCKLVKKNQTVKQQEPTTVDDSSQSPAGTPTKSSVAVPSSVVGAALKAAKQYTLVLFEDIDLVFGEKDEGFVSAVNSLMVTTKRPIVVTTTTSAPLVIGGDVACDVAPSVTGLLKHKHRMWTMARPDADTLAIHLQLIGLAGSGAAVPLSAARRLALTASCDARAALLALQYKLMGRPACGTKGSDARSFKHNPDHAINTELCQQEQSNSDLGIKDIFPSIKLEELSLMASTDISWINLDGFVETKPDVSSGVILQDSPASAVTAYVKNSDTNEGNSSMEVSANSLLDKFSLMAVGLPSILSYRESHAVLPLLLPLPKHRLVARQRKYPLSLQDPALKKVPLYQKYSWLDVDSDSDDEKDSLKKDVKDGEGEFVKNEVKFKVNTGSSITDELRSFRKSCKGQEGDVNKIGKVSESSQEKSVQKNNDAERICRDDNKSKPGESLTSSNIISNTKNNLNTNKSDPILSSLRYLSKLHDNFADLDILSKAQLAISDRVGIDEGNSATCLQSSMFMKRDELHNAEVQSVMQVIDQFKHLSNHQCQLEKGSKSEASLEDVNSSESCYDHTDTRQKICSELDYRALRTCNKRLGSSIKLFDSHTHQKATDGSQSHSKVTDDECAELLLALTVPDYSFSKQPSETTSKRETAVQHLAHLEEYSTNLSLTRKLIATVPLHRRLQIARSIGCDTLPYLRQLARQDALNNAVTQLKRSRRRPMVNRGGGLLGQLGVEGLGETDLELMANALMEL